MHSLILLALLARVPAGFPIPLAPGTWWEYRESWTERLRGIDSITDARTRFAVRGSVESPFLYQSGGDDPVAAPVETGEGWIRLGPWTGEDPLPVPLEVGRSGPSSEAGSSWRVEAEEDVTVPAGRFRALRCAFRTRRTESVLWIAPGVGVVRETHGPPGLRPDLERVLLAWSGERNSFRIQSTPGVDEPPEEVLGPGFAVLGGGRVYSRPAGVAGGHRPSLPPRSPGWRFLGSTFLSLRRADGRCARVGDPQAVPP